MHCLLFKDINFLWSGVLTMVAKDPPKLNIIITCLISLNIISFYSKIFPPPQHSQTY